MHAVCLFVYICVNVILAIARIAVHSKLDVI